MDQLHLIQVFLAVVDAQGLAGAARKLAVSPPAVTRAINELEAQLGVRLLTRTTRVVRVTEAGARYADDCRRVLADLEEANRQVTGLHSTPRGRLFVTAPQLFGALHVAPVMARYLEQYPEVNAQAWFLDRVVNLVEEGVDVAVRIGPLPDSSLQAICVGQVRRVLCAAPAYLDKASPLQHPNALHAHTLISSTAIHAGQEWRFDEAGQPLAVRVAPRLVTNTNDAALAATLTGLGITRLMSYQCADALRTGHLLRLLPDFEPPPVPVHLVHREGRHPSRKVRAFLDLAIACLRDLDALR